LTIEEDAIVDYFFFWIVIDSSSRI